MSIVSKLLVALILVASAGFVYLAAGVLRTQGSWQAVVAGYEQKIDEAKKANDQILNGGQRARETAYRPENGLPKVDQADPLDKPGIRQLEIAVENLLVDRGPVWHGTRGQVTETGDASVTIDRPKPHQIKDKTVLYVFEASRPGEQTAGAYLGEFKVTGVTDQTLALSPAARFTPAELRKVGESQPTWVLFEVLPIDRYDVFAGLTDEQLSALLPEASRALYLRHGKPAETTDPPEQVLDGKFERPLRDYGQALRTLRLELWANQEAAALANSDLAAMQKAVAAANQEVTLQDAEIARLEDDLKKSTAERDLVKEQAGALEARVAAIEAETTKLLEENKKLAAQWTAMQLEAAGKINQLSRAP
jgi:hypothetical protein